MPGLTRKDPPPLSSAARTVTKSSISGLEEERDQAEDERVEHDRLGQCEAEPLDRGDLLAHLGLTGHRLDDLAEDVAHADAGADGAETGADAKGDRLAVLARLGQYRDGFQIHDCSFGSVTFGGRRAAEVDGSEGREDEGLQS